MKALTTPVKQFFEREPVRVAVLVIIALIILLGLVVPWLSMMPREDMDSGWLLVMSQSWRGHFHFGSDILWHYGPFGFLYGNMYYPAIWPEKPLIIAAIAVVFCYGAVKLLTYKSVPKEQGAFPVVLLSAFMTQSTDAFWLSFPLFMVLSVFLLPLERRKYLMPMLLMATALGGLVKFPYLVAGVVAVLVLDGYGFLVLRRRPYYSMAYVALWVAFWLVAGQSLVDIPAYLHGAYAMSAGFASAMSVNAGFFAQVVFLLGIGLFLAGYYQVWCRSMSKFTALWYSCGILALCYIISRLGFTNANDYHRLAAIIYFVMIALILKDYGWKSVPHIIKKTLVVYVVCVTCVYFYIMANYAGGIEAFKAFFTEEVPTEGRDKLANPEKRFAEAMEKVKKKFPLPEVEGTADIYSYRQSVLMANGMNYHPRPILQSYHAYTDYFAQKNAKFLASENAPQHIFFNIEPINNHFPSQEDGASWPLLINNYEARGFDSGYLHLKRKTVIPAQPEPKPLRTLEAHWNEAIKLPVTTKPVWAKITMQPTLLGRLLEMLLYVPQVGMGVLTESGYHKGFHFMPHVAKSPMLISPLVEDTTQFIQLFSGDTQALSPRDVREVQFAVNAPKWIASRLYQPEITIELFTLPLPELKATRFKEWQEAAIYNRLMAAPLEGNIFTPEDVDTQHLKYLKRSSTPGMMVQGPARLKLPLHKDEKKFKARLLRPEGLYAPGEMTLTLYGITKSGKEKRLKKETIPGGTKEKEVEKRINLTINRAAYEALVIEVGATNPDASNFLLFTDVELK